MSHFIKNKDIFNSETQSKYDMPHSIDENGEERHEPGQETLMVQNEQDLYSLSRMRRQMRKDNYLNC